MPTLTTAQEAWMSTHIAEGLHRLGLPVTPDTLTEQMQGFRGAMARAEEFADAPPSLIERIRTQRGMQQVKVAEETRIARSPVVDRDDAFAPPPPSLIDAIRSSRSR